jgi:hypothetical protein
MEQHWCEDEGITFMKNGLAVIPISVQFPFREEGIFVSFQTLELAVQLWHIDRLPCRQGYGKL